MPEVSIIFFNNAKVLIQFSGKAKKQPYIFHLEIVVTIIWKEDGKVSNAHRSKLKKYFEL